MKVFISWSGELSKNIAEIFRQWIPGVIQAAKPYYSPDDITKGTRWSSEISKELDASRIGIICLTRDNLSSPWIMFEAGALSKNIDKSKMCPLLFGIEPSDIQGPLVQFQAAKFSKKEMKKVIKMINSELGDTALSSDVLDNVFDMWWPRLDEKIQAELNAINGIKENLRTERDILEEVLKLTREISINKSKLKERESRVPFGLINDIFRTIQMVGERIAETESVSIIEHLERLYFLVEELIMEMDIPKDYKMEIRHKLKFLGEENRMLFRKYTPTN